LYEAALDRMARELAAVQKLTDSESLKLVEQHLERGPKRGARADAVEAESETEAEATGDNIEAAA
jgi:CarD family transcriptional regulator